MKVILIKFAVLVVAGLFSHVLLAKDWLLTVPEDFDLKVVNGAKYSAPLFQSKHVQLLKLDKAREKQQIVMTYSQVFDDGDDMDVVKSKAFMVEFSSELQGEELAVEYDHPSYYSTARIFAKKPVVRITFNKGAVPVV
ncbi:MAG: DUF2057 family protein, partial [Sinobacterium sp.]|nr:DUF2057 family protein [Sinobacterium sp.]